MDIQDYIAVLEQRQETERQAKAAKDAEVTAAREAARIAEWEKFNEAIPLLLPEIIRPYFNPQIPEISDVSSYQRPAVYIDVPGCTTIRMFAKPTEIGYELVTNERDYGIEVATYELKYFYDEEELHVHLDQYINVSSLENALLVARRAHQKLLGLQETENEQNESRAQSLAARAERKQQQEEQQRLAEQRAAEEKEIESLERNSIFRSIASDPVGFALIKIFAALQDERRDYQAQLESMSEHAGSLEGWHSERVAQLERSLDEAKRNADEYRRAKEDAESDLYTAEQKLKKAKRQGVAW